MSEPQIGIFALGDASQSFLEFVLRSEGAASQAVEAVANLNDLRKTIQEVNLVVGFRPELWRQVVPRDAPSDAQSFSVDLVGPDGYRVPATQADIVIWLAAASYDTVFDFAVKVVQRLSSVATLAREVIGWAYRRNRDLTGFEDGTENPALPSAFDIVYIPEGEPGAGGSILLLQQWKHLTDQWMALDIAVQEKVIGRTKPDSIEFPEDRLPADSHVARTTLVENGQELDIFRRNTPYGSVSDHGTLFVGFAKQQHRLQRMLERMAGIPDGIRDALTRYTVPLTGSYYFIPALSTLATLASPTQES